MTDRRVREQQHALPQRLARTEAEVRALRLRTYPGAVRSGRMDNYKPQMSATPAPLIHLSIPAGRWIAFGSVTITPTVPFGDALFTVSLAVTDPSTGVAAGPSSDLPETYVYIPPVASFGFPYQTAQVIGDVVVDEAAIVTLFSVSNTGTAYSAANARLRMLPV